MNYEFSHSAGSLFCISTNLFNRRPPRRIIVGFYNNLIAVLCRRLIDNSGYMQLFLCRNFFIFADGISRHSCISNRYLAQNLYSYFRTNIPNLHPYFICSSPVLHPEFTRSSPVVKPGKCPPNTHSMPEEYPVKGSGNSIWILRKSQG